jgi:hypothetical protein
VPAITFERWPDGPVKHLAIEFIAFPDRPGCPQFPGKTGF